MRSDCPCGKHLHMAASKPARQCTLIMLSTGKRCGGVALRGKPFCYHHDGNHKEHTRERILCQRLDRLGDKLDAMDTAQLLNFLQQKLTALPKTLSRFPEVSYALVYTLDRIGEITSLESTLRRFLQQNQQFVAACRQCRANPATYPQYLRNQRFSSQANFRKLNEINELAGAGRIRNYALSRPCGSA